jgi:hypothetical protein
MTDKIDIINYYEIGVDMINLIKSFNKLYLVDKNKINENNEEIKNNFNKVFEDLQLLRIDYSILIKILEKKYNH